MTVDSPIHQDKPIWDHTLRLAGPKEAFEAALTAVEEALDIDRERAFDDYPAVEYPDMETIILGLHIDQESLLSGELINAHPDVTFTHLAWDASGMLLLQIFGGDNDGVYPLTRHAFADITLRLDPVLAYQLPLPPANYRDLLNLLGEAGMLFGARMGYSLTVEMSELREGLEKDEATIDTVISRDRSALPWGFIKLSKDQATICDAFTEEELVSFPRSELEELATEGESVMVAVSFGSNPGQIWIGAL